MQDQVMKFDPATGAPQPYPSHAEQWRRWFGLDCAWLFNPWSGDRRNAFDVGSDLNGRLIVAPETLGNDMGVAARLQNTANIEINGVKMEVDLRQARIVHENVRVGTKVKILEKSGYSGSTVYPGVVVGFEGFRDLPTIIVAYVNTGYSSPGIAFAYINAKSAEKWDMVPSIDDELPVAKSDVLAHFDREIEKALATQQDLAAKRDFFLRHFNRYFAEQVSQ